jgi:hypothetical protein
VYFYVPLEKPHYMRNLFCYLASFTALLLLSLSACIKEPSPDVPVPPKPEWLLTKVVVLQVQAEPEGGPVYNSAEVYEYSYNAQHKPYLLTHHYGEDTNHLQPGRKYEIFYDKQLRPARVEGSGEIPRRSVTSYFYKGNEKYPERAEQVYVDSSGTSTPAGTTRYVYQDSLVFWFYGADKDSSAYVYDGRGDFIGYYSWRFDDVTVYYDEYDNAVNVGRFLNLDFSAINVPGNDNGHLFSAHNWTHNAMDVLQRSISYDSMGRVRHTFVQLMFPTRNVNTYYYYTLIK